MDEDNVLNVLGEDTKVMHDHNKVNYNEKYQYENLECDEHLQRNLKGNADNTGHPELLELKELISKTNNLSFCELFIYANFLNEDYSILFCIRRYGRIKYN